MTQTPLQRRAVLAYGSNDNSRLIRDRTTGELTGWVDVTGMGRPLPVDPLEVSPRTRGEIQDGDTQIIRCGAKIIDPVKFSDAAQLTDYKVIDLSWWELLAFAALCIALIAGIVAALCLHYSRSSETVPVEPVRQTTQQQRPYVEFEIDAQGRLVHK